MQLKHDIDNGLNLNVIDTVLARMAKSLSSHLSISKSSIKQLFLDDFELPLTQYNIHIDLVDCEFNNIYKKLNL